MTLSRVLPSGLEIVVKTCGKQTLTQVFDEAGNLLKTRIKSVEKSVVPPVRQKKIGFAMNSGADIPAKNIFTITKNEYNHTTQESIASVLDRVYLNGERVGERVISAKGNDDAMDAMNCIKRKAWHNTLNKILRFFNDGKIVKENRYEFDYYTRRSRYSVDFELEKNIENLKHKLAKIKFQDTEATKKEISKLEEEIDKLRQSLTSDYDKVEDAQIKCDRIKNRISHFKEEQKTIDTVNKLLTQEFKTEEEFDDILTDVCKIKTTNKQLTYFLDEIESNYLQNSKNISDGIKARLKAFYNDELKTGYSSVISELTTEATEAEKALKKIQKEYIRKENGVNKKAAVIIEKNSNLKKELVRQESQNKKLETKRKKLEEQISQLETQRHTLTLDFKGTSLRADIDGIDFTL